MKWWWGKLAIALALSSLNLVPAWALESGSGRFTLFQGMDRTGSPFQSSDYLALGLNLEQSTLNWGRWDAQVLALGNDWGRDPRLGYGLLRVRQLWLREGMEGNFLLGDSFLETGLPRLPFEHFSLPFENLRGAVSQVYGDKYQVGAHAGTLTNVSFQLAQAMIPTDTNLAGAYVRYGAPGKLNGCLAVDGFSDPQGKRLLPTCLLSYPLGAAKLIGLTMHDSASGKSAGAAGIRQEGRWQQWEAGVSHVPNGFIYYDRQATLAAGQTLGFFTYRHFQLKTNYYLEGSGGRLSFANDENWLIRGTVGGGWRFRLRDRLGGSLGVSWQGTSNQQFHLLPSLSYNHYRRHLNLYGTLVTDFTTNRLVVQGGVPVVQTLPPGFITEAAETTTIFRYSVESGFDYSPPGKNRWGGSLRYENVRTQQAQDFAYQSVTAQLRMGRYLPYETTMDLSVNGGFTFGQGSNSAIYGATLNLNIGAFEDWRFFVFGRFYYSKLPQEFASILVAPNPAYEVRSGVERQFYWGEGAPVYGLYPKTGFKGVGTITGRVFEDKNHNGIYDPGDVPMPKILMLLDDGFIVDTDAQGIYHYNNVVAGEHTLGLEPASYPVRLVSKHPDGQKIKLNPRENLKIDWPLTGK